jgi:hypothetical protein
VDGLDGLLGVHASLQRIEDVVSDHHSFGSLLDVDGGDGFLDLLPTSLDQGLKPRFYPGFPRALCRVWRCGLRPLLVLLERMATSVPIWLSCGLRPLLVLLEPWPG